VARRAARCCAKAASTQDLLRAARTVHISSRSVYFTPESLENALASQNGFDSLGLSLVEDPGAADLLLSVDRPLFTYTFAFSVTDSRTSRVVDAGKVTAIDGGAAAAKIAKLLVERWAKARQAAPASKMSPLPIEPPPSLVGPPANQNR
jgi:hypothetical protein